VLVVPQDGTMVLLEKLRDLYLSASTFMHLFKNNYSPVETSVLGDFTESTFPGYAAGLSAWNTAAFLNGSGKAEIDADSATVFTCSGSASESAYGYYVMDPTDTELLWAERFASPVVISTAGDFVSVLARFTMLTEFTGP